MYCGKLIQVVSLYLIFCMLLEIMNREAKQHQYSIMGNDPETLDRELLLTLSKNNSYSLVLEKLLPKAMGAKKWRKGVGIYCYLTNLESHNQ